MANILKGNETITALVLANVCIAFVILAAYSPVTSRPFLLVAATAIGLFSLYPLYFILQRPRRFIVARETEGDKTVYVVRLKGYLWWYDATDRKGQAVIFNTIEEAQKYIKEDLVTMIINDRMRRKSVKKEFQVILDSKKMTEKADTASPDRDQQATHQKQETSPTPQPEMDEEEIIPDNQAAIANMWALGAKNKEEKDKTIKEKEEKENPPANAGKDEKETYQDMDTDLQKQQDASVSKTAAHPDERPEHEDGYEQEEIDDPFESGYQGPDEDDETENENDTERTPVTELTTAPDGATVQTEGDDINEQLFDVIDKFNKSVNHPKALKKPERPQPAINEEPPKQKPPKIPVVTTAQIVEEQALVHAHRAETVKDALTKILYHQQMVEQKEQPKSTKTPAPTQEHQKVQAVPKSRRNKNKSLDGIPTKTIRHKPSSEDSFLKKRQMTLFEMNGFISSDNDSPDHVKEQQTVTSKAVATPDKESPEPSTTGGNNSSGGSQIVKTVQNAANPTATTTPAENTKVRDDATAEHPEEVLPQGSSSHTKKSTENIADEPDKTMPLDDTVRPSDNDTLPL